MTVDRRVTRSAAAACAALALGCALLVPAVATAEDGNQLVGPAETLLIENVHAAGKVLVIGSEQAQLTNPDDTPAAAAIFEIGETASAITAQEVLAYPVLGKEDVFVFTNADGEVLARRPRSHRERSGSRHRDHVRRWRSGSAQRVVGWRDDGS